MAKKSTTAAKNAPVATATLYVLSEAALVVAAKAGYTKQAKPEALGTVGKAWRAEENSKMDSNTRALALALLASVVGDQPFTEDTVKAVWTKDSPGFGGSATPASRIRAFKLNKYFVEHNPA